MISCRTAFVLVAATVAFAAATPLDAQVAPVAASAGPPADQQTVIRPDVILTGTRQRGIRAAESPGPIQIISSSELLHAGKTDLINALAQLVPSLIAQSFAFDMGNQTLQARLRGLSPNDVLILVNGRRRHTTANLAVDSASPYEGGAAADLNFIPLSAVDHVEVLTEGAAAQYGSDAIAGVINIILRNNTSGGELDGAYGGYFDGGGVTSEVEGAAGFQPIERSYFDATGQVYSHGHSDRGNVDPRVVDPANINPADGAAYPLTNIPLAPGWPNLNLIQGDAEVHSKLVAYNTGFALGGDTQLYSFGTYGYKNARSYENYRLPTTSAYTDPKTRVTTYQYPYGFDPLEESKEQDFQLNVGLKGVVADWNWDLGTGFGEDHFEMYTVDSTNADLYAATGASPTDFYDGKFIATQSTSSLDIDRDFEIGLAGPLNVAFGGEYRRETYLLGPATDPASYLGGGAQSFPGFAPHNAVDAARKSHAGYIDLAAKIIGGVRIDAAGRFEHYSDFGNATIGKLTARWDIAPQFAARGTASTGFRAPTLAEEHYTAISVGPTTAFGQLAPDGPGSALLGIGNGLEPERSTNLSLGMVLQPLENLSATIDAYQIILTNRIVGSGTLFGTINGLPFHGAVNINEALAQSGLSIDPHVLASGTTGIDLFTNGIDTRTRGVELSLLSPNDYAFGHVDWSLAGSYEYSVVTRQLVSPAGLGGQPLFNATALAELTTATPRLILNIGIHWSLSAFYVNLRELLYGPSADYLGDSGEGPTGIPIYYRNQVGTIPLTNVEVGINVMKSLTLAVGATNLFNRYPERINPALTATFNAADDNSGVQKYPSFAPFGIDGGFYYARIGYRW